MDLPPDGGVEVLHLGDLRRRNHLDDHLRDAVSGLHGEVRLRVVEEHDTHRAVVVHVDHPCCTRREEGQVPSLNPRKTLPRDVKKASSPPSANNSGAWSCKESEYNELIVMYNNKKKKDNVGNSLH